MRHPPTSKDGRPLCRAVRWCAMSTRAHAPLVDCVLARRSGQSTTSQLGTRSTRGNGCDVVVIALSCELALPVIRKRRRATWRCLANLTNDRIGRSISKNRVSPSLKRTVAYRFEGPVLSGASREFEAADDSAALALGLVQALAWICPAPPSARARSLGKSAMSLSTECPQNELWRLRFLPRRRLVRVRRVRARSGQALLADHSLKETTFRSLCEPRSRSIRALGGRSRQST